MNKEQYLSICAIEEAAELIQAFCKSLRFGNLDKYNGISNQEQVELEFVDLCSILSMKSFPLREDLDHLMEMKINKVNHYMEKSVAQGILETEEKPQKPEKNDKKQQFSKEYRVKIIKDFFETNMSGSECVERLEDLISGKTV